MTLTPRDALSDIEEQAAQSCFRGVCKKMTFDATNRIVTVQAVGYAGEANASDPALKEQSLSMPVTFPYGYLSMMPAGNVMELEISETAAGLICVSTRSALPAACPTPAEGDSMQYSSGGSYTHHDADDDTVIEPNSGKDIKLGKDASRAVAIDGDPVISNTDFDAWALTVESGIKAAGGPTLDAWGASASVGDVAASATKAVAE